MTHGDVCEPEGAVPSKPTNLAVRRAADTTRYGTPFTDYFFNSRLEQTKHGRS